MNRLDEILRAKREEIERLRPREKELRDAAFERIDFRSFRSALERKDNELALIAEVKSVALGGLDRAGIRSGRNCAKI